MEENQQILEPKLPVGKEELMRLTGILQRYKSGKARLESRVIESENWWKLRNSPRPEERQMGAEGFKSVSGWLHNVIVSKHADALDAYPEANILPREEGDRGEAKMLSGILPCILEQNRFEEIYSDVMWQKLKTGTGVYKVVWDAGKLWGLGDISIQRVNLLNLYWEPGITDIQKSRYLFHTELWDKDILTGQYPFLEGKLKGQSFCSAKFLYDDHVDTENKSTVIEVYYHKTVEGRSTLQYVKYVDDQVLYATENEPDMAINGLYDHGLYPYVMDVLFPIEGSPCGYGYVDLCKNPQTEIDLLKTAFVKNAMAGATPRYFKRMDGGVNEEEFLNLNKPVVSVNGNLGEDSLRPIGHSPLDGIYVSVLDRTIQELRETTGNTETSTGNISSGVTAAAAIAALQEASGKGSRDANAASYRAFERVVDLVIELIRQFYTMPRRFRIVGDLGAWQYVSYSNQGLRPKDQGMDFGVDMGCRLPVFDVKVSAQKQSPYTKMSQNELALQLFGQGFFNPELAERAMMCLDMMDFEGRDGLMQKLSGQKTLFDQLSGMTALAIELARAARPDMVPGLEIELSKLQGGGTSSGGGTPKTLPKKEPAAVNRARSRAALAGEPYKRKS